MAIVLPKRAEILPKIANDRPPSKRRSPNIVSPLRVNFSPNNNGCIVARLWRLELFIAIREGLAKGGVCHIER